MEQKIAELTEKIYKEGVEKGEEEKKAIIESAQAEAASIKANAEKEAEKIKAEAQAQAEELKKNTASEIRLSSQQAISALKQQIVNLLMVKTVDDPTSATLADPSVIKELITTIVQGWKSGGNEVASLAILLPEESRNALEKSLESSLKKVLKEGVTLSFSKSLKGGFQIAPQDDTFKISLSDEDFIEFFKEYLRPKTRSLLFEE